MGEVTNAYKISVRESRRIDYSGDVDMNGRMRLIGIVDKLCVWRCGMDKTGSR
jgi:hypothetical protein